MTIAWNLNGNPTGTAFQIFKATDNGFAGATESLTVTQTIASFTKLLPGTTYYFHVRAVSLNNNPTAFDTTFSAVTGVVAPISQGNIPKTPYTPQANSVLIYHFDEGSGTVVFDSSTLNNTGTLTCTFLNCSSPTYTTGRPGFKTAVDFSGEQNTYCDVADAASLNTSADLSLEAWIHPDGTVQIPEATIIAKGSSSYVAYGLDIQDGKARFFLHDNEPVPNPTLHTVSSIQNIPTGRWSYIAGVYEAAGPSMKIYVDGILSKTSNFTFNAGGTARLINDHTLSVGSRKSGAVDYDLGFQGFSLNFGFNR
ncbi:MAG: hypothetical protein IH899_15380 [Planctomycetes bacterium]|nr:hypothetical protein [Planctomycetota bacterium]